MDVGRLVHVSHQMVRHDNIYLNKYRRPRIGALNNVMFVNNNLLTCRKIVGGAREGCIHLNYIHFHHMRHDNGDEFQGDSSGYSGKGRRSRTSKFSDHMKVL